MHITGCGSYNCQVHHEDHDFSSKATTALLTQQVYSNYQLSAIQSLRSGSMRSNFISWSRYDAAFALLFLDVNEFLYRCDLYSAVKVLYKELSHGPDEPRRLRLQGK
jgi:hypothetical protein